MTTLDDLELEDLIERLVAAKRIREQAVKAAEEELRKVQAEVNAETEKRLGVCRGDKVTLLHKGPFEYYAPFNSVGFCDGVYLDAATYNNHRSISVTFTPAVKKNPNKKDTLHRVTVSIRPGDSFEIKKRE